MIFVHGIGAAASVWKRFDIPGHPAFYISFVNRFADPAKQVPELAKFIGDVLKKTKAKKVILVCHSMGGLVARKYLVDHKSSHNVERLILLSTPNLGSIWLYFKWSPAARAMRPGSKFLKELNSQDMPKDLKYISIISDTKALPYRLVNLLLFREGGDGAVPVSSQKLSSKCVPNFAGLDYSEIKISLPHFQIPKGAEQAILQAHR